ncbi:excalibur calcium-binding domain-containing protein [Saccharibacillus sp. CPCC 101409]|uniref:excalibur calcium-binding domain-containing protein n=1 Tax=Saccharibacillus sp. CPCC 101409 TaxID=3058041 RepID=UPI0026734145|nr:excalibur calcium-binding domain-containing protein [Saccharibacillus sp. CPCC 101409]MDO3409320.1 excalibur calcium-binding domain-containing protein [Saccharibacillus sp. CPCC 101409]
MLPLVLLLALAACGNPDSTGNGSLLQGDPSLLKTEAPEAEQPARAAGGSSGLTDGTSEQPQKQDQAQTLKLPNTAKDEQAEPEKQESVPADETADERGTSYWRIAGGDANIRSAPDYTSEPVMIGREGRDLEYLHVKYFDPRDSRVWYNVRSEEGQTGWISGAVVSASDGQYDEQSEREADEYAAVSEPAVQYQVLENANIRRSPSIGSESAGTVAAGAVLESENEQRYDPSDGRTWYRVEIPSGIEGWISGKLIVEYGSSAESSLYQDEPTGVYYENCAAAEAAGAAPVYADDPGYASWLDRDSDGIGCEITDWDSYDSGYSGSADSSSSSGAGTVYFKNCAAARAAGAAPVYAGDPGYSRKLDRDGDGIGCE